ncbi:MULTISPECIES: site-specific integrase [unclassified Bradyrhizobium]|uniref:site-specific integrase n=1 Tax=unclassified Bradyrhizobium TaxID=2631580 RepID=UPI0029160738|nr:MULTISPECIES: site-specific integrase [unclassified Bradyrhizobium]
MTFVALLPRRFHERPQTRKNRTEAQRERAFMAKIKITKRAVETLKVQAKDYIAFDTELPGFGVRVMPSGKRFFLVQYRRRGRTRRVMIGQFGIVTAELARREATIKLGSVRGADGDPAALRDAERQSTTMKELGERFLSQYVPARCKPSTQAEYRRCVELFLNPFFAKQRVRSVTTADVAELHGSHSHIPYQANRVLGVLSKMMNLAETWGIRDKHTNPCEDIDHYPERKRERFLSLTELRRLGQALAEAETNKAEGKYAVAAFRLLLLTGCRLSEIQKLEWRFVYLEESELRLPDSKTGAKTVHVGDAAVAVFKTIPRIAGNPYVIAGKKEESHLTDLQHPWRRIRKAARLDDVRIHDLRHTFASGGLLVGEGLPMIGKLLGHTQVQTTARYAHLASHPVKQAATRISDRLASALFGSVAEPNVKKPLRSDLRTDELDDDLNAA